MSSKRKTPESSNEEKTLKKPKSNGFWALGLLETMKDPLYIVEEDDLVVTTKDKFAKAEFHYLILPKEDITSLKSVTSKHLDLLKHMEEVAEKLINEDKHMGRKFNIGYHAEASMIRLHLHVISDDMNSPCVKTKKHWNSFTTKFFLDYKEVHKELETHGKITLPSSELCKQLINSNLKCHKCSYVPKHMPDLKRHIVSHINKNE